MEITNEGVGIMVIALGGLLVIAGIALVVVLLREGRFWESLMKSSLGMDLPDFGQGFLAPLVQQVVLELLGRIFIYVRVGTLIGGAGVSVLGAVLIVIGIYIWS